MKLITYYTQRRHTIELYEVGFPDDMEDAAIRECINLLDAGASTSFIPRNVQFTEVSSFDIEVEPFFSWDCTSENDEPVSMAQTAILRDKLTYEKFISFIWDYNGDAFIKFIMHLARTGYKGDMKHMIWEFYQKVSQWVPVPPIQQAGPSAEAETAIKKGTQEKSDHPLPWKEVKTLLDSRSAPALIRIIAECFKQPGAALTIRKAALETYKDTDVIIASLEAELYDTFWSVSPRGDPLAPSLSEAQGIMSLAKKITKPNPIRYLDFMIKYILHAVRFSTVYGGMGEHYYTSIVTMYDDAAEMILTYRDSLPLQLVLQYMDTAIAENTFMGWGFDDKLRGINATLKGKLGIHTDV